MRVYLSLGANLGDRLANLELALRLLAAGGCRVLRRSPVYETRPLYFLKQPAFFNMAAACETALSPSELLALIGRVERALRRRRLRRNGPRTIDVDILFYGDRALSGPGLEVPHPRLAEREFVLAPLADIAPRLRHPADGRTAAAMLAALADRGGVRRLPGSCGELMDWFRSLPPPPAARHYSLANIRRALRRLGSPQRRMGAVLHITGSTGKTSTAAMAAAALTASGHRTGLYTSPHVRGPRERVRLGGRDIPEKDFLRLFLRVESVCAGELSFFETLTAMAFLYFAEKGTRFAVVEAGLGGRLDATNAADGAVAGITSVSLEHTDLLGGTAAGIAGHKAGIIKKGADAVLGEGLPAAARRVIARRASAVGARLRAPGPLPADAAAALAGAGAFQLRNAAFALTAAALAARRAGEDLDLPAAARALRRALPAGRFQRLRLGGRRVVVDGAHNAEGLDALLGEFRSPPVCVAAFMRDKDAAPLLRRLAASCARLVLTRSHSYRSAAPAALRRLLPAAARREAVLEPDPLRALRLAARLAPPGVPVLATGSLYLAGDILAGLRGRRALHPREMPVKAV